MSISKGLILVQQLPVIPEDWDYEQSIAKVKPLIYKWKNLTLEIGAELYIARERLSRETVRWDKCPTYPSWAEYCESIGLEKRTANRWLAAIFGPQRLPSPLLPKLESQVLYADPPWSFSNIGFDQSAAQHYRTLTLDEICNYRDQEGKSIKRLASEKRSVLFLWVPEALLPEGLTVMKEWGFCYKAQMVWVKDKSPGIGWWVKSKHELLFIGSKGEELHPAIRYDSVFESPVRGHSQKPEMVYDMIEAMYTGPYIEVFARNTRMGWTSWGDEV